jgi:hypothetical protein
MGRLSSRVGDPGRPGSLSSRARAGRWEELLRRFPDLSDRRVLDLGGTLGFWLSAPVRPAHVTVVNLFDVPDTEHEGLTAVRGDACDSDLRGFDLVISNSLLEHVGGPARRRQLADVIHAAADAHWVQTPYRYFPVEPHWMCPGMQWLPLAARARVARWWPLGHYPAPVPKEAALDLVLEIDLLTVTEMRVLFPDSALWRERYLGLTKSLVAVKDA